MSRNGKYSKQSRSIVCLGPPNSGKSVFSYLLFKQLRGLKDDAWLVDCDIFAPTFRRHRFHSEEEDPYVVPVAYMGKPQDAVKPEFYDGYLEIVLMGVNQKGRIVVDGPRKFSKHTEVLLSKVDAIMIVCRGDLTEAKMIDCGFSTEGRAIHPHEFLSTKKQIVYKITTRLDNRTASFEEGANGDNISILPGLRSPLYATWHELTSDSLPKDAPS